MSKIFAGIVLIILALNLAFNLAPLPYDIYIYPAIMILLAALLWKTSKVPAIAVLILGIIHAIGSFVEIPVPYWNYIFQAVLALAGVFLIFARKKTMHERSLKRRLRHAQAQAVPA